MLFNVTKFVDWPDWKRGDQHAPFVLCLLGADSSSAGIESLMQGKTVAGKATTIRTLNKNDDGANCHVLYVARSERKRFEQLAPVLTKSSVLTVGDEEWFASDQRRGAASVLVPDC
jgi:hypothetical protein